MDADRNHPQSPAKPQNHSLPQPTTAPSTSQQPPAATQTATPRPKRKARKRGRHPQSSDSPQEPSPLAPRPRHACSTNASQTNPTSRSSARHPTFKKAVQLAHSTEHIEKGFPAAESRELGPAKKRSRADNQYNPRLHFPVDAETPAASSHNGSTPRSGGNNSAAENTSTPRTTPEHIEKLVNQPESHKRSRTSSEPQPGVLHQELPDVRDLPDNFEGSEALHDLRPGGCFDFEAPLGQSAVSRNSAKHIYAHTGLLQLETPEALNYSEAVGVSDDYTLPFGDPQASFNYPDAVGGLGNDTLPFSDSQTAFNYSEIAGGPGNNTLPVGGPPAALTPSGLQPGIEGNEFSLYGLVDTEAATNLLEFTSDSNDDLNFILFGAKGLKKPLVTATTSQSVSNDSFLTIGRDPPLSSQYPDQEQTRTVTPITSPSTPPPTQTRPRAPSDLTIDPRLL